jgi:hypothetical protein
MNAGSGVDECGIETIYHYVASKSQIGFLVVLLSVGYQSLKAAIRNPAQSLRYE